jgi:superfamily II DNA helicase RecQ
VSAEELRAEAVERLGLSEEEFEKALDKLAIHGGARVDFGGNVTRGEKGWKKSYSMQAQHRAEQFEKVVRFTQSGECRMAALVRHFGDEQDASRPCGKCDICDPAGAVLRQFRHVTPIERDLIQQIVELLRSVEWMAPGTLQRNLDAAGAISRDELNALLDAMARANLVAVEEAEFEKNGQSIRFRKLRLTDAGFDVRSTTPLSLLIADGIVEEFAGKGTAARRSRAKQEKPARKAEKKPPVELNEAQQKLAEGLKEWRAAEARRRGVPAYMVLHDRALVALAVARPQNLRQLLELDGIGSAKVEKFGEDLLGLCRDAQY